MDEVSCLLFTCAPELADERSSIHWGKSFLKTLITMEVQQEGPGGKNAQDLNNNAEGEKEMETASDVVGVYRESYQ
jgi:hypothetical protein